MMEEVQAPPFVLRGTLRLLGVEGDVCGCLDEVKMCLVGPHPICVEVGILCSC